MAREGSGSQDEGLRALVQAVRASNKHADICPELIERIGRRELFVRRNAKEAIKATKRKLHQVGAAYLHGRPRFGHWVAALQEARHDPDEMRNACREIMTAHASTRERLPILDRFFAETLAHLGTVSSILDLACGHNPLAIPWMPLAPGARYAAVDIYVELMAFLGEAIVALGMTPDAQARDVLGEAPYPLLPDGKPYDVALLLKAVPCLEQIDRAAGLPLLRAIPARHLLVSFPVRSLGGRDKQMRANYQAHFEELVATERWAVARHTYDSELAFLIDKGC